MSPENLDDSADKSDQRLIRDLANRLGEETFVMSGNFGKLDSFQTLVQFGEPALSVLLEDIEEPDWWRVQAICQIADELGKPIKFPREAPGMYDIVSRTITGWAKQYGYIVDESPTN